MLDKIYDWLDDHQVHNILLLTGSPGAGKSAIASTLVSVLQGAGRLGSGFFFKRDDSSMSDPAACWRTVAFDLAGCDSIIAKRLVENIDGRKVDPNRDDIESHFKYLVEDPLRELWRSRVEAVIGSQSNVDSEVHKQAANGEQADDDKTLIKGLPIVVIDAMDECGADTSQSAQRRTFINTITQWSRLPRSLKLVVMSRDERIPKPLRAVCFTIVLNTGDTAKWRLIMTFVYFSRSVLKLS